MSQSNRPRRAYQPPALNLPDPKRISPHGKQAYPNEVNTGFPPVGPS